MPEFSSEYEETIALLGVCGAALRLDERFTAGAAEYKSHALPGDTPHYPPDQVAAMQHIKLEIALDFERKGIAGVATLTLAPINNGLTELDLDAVELDIQQVTLEGHGDVSYETEGEKLRVKLPTALPAGQPFSLAIHYSSEPRRGLYFVGPDAAYPNKPVQAWTQGEDEDSRYWFPCHDFPHQKSTSEIIVTVPEPFYALSNGALVNTMQDASAKTKTYHWRQEVRHSCYLIMLAVGDFAEITADANGVPIQYYVQKGREADAERTLQLTPDMVSFFSDKLDVPYPYNKYAQVFVGDFIFGGMENTTATTLTDTALMDERAFLDNNANSLVAHELAHQWFGDLLTCQEWAHGWLNEGFATYFDALYKQHHDGEDEFRYWMYGTSQSYFSEDPGHYRRPIVTNVYHAPIDLFDRHLYEKGALVLHMLRYVLGEDAWWKAMHHYVTKHREQNVVTSDLQRAVEEATGRSMGWFFDQWVLRPGYPEFKVDYSWDDTLKAAKLTVNQTQSTDNNTPIFRMPIDVAFITDSGTETRRVEVTEKEHVFYIPLEQKPLSVRFDPDNWVLKKLDFTRSKDMLHHQLQHSADGWGRVEAAQGLSKQNNPESIKALTEALLQDSFWAVQSAAAQSLAAIHSASALEGLLQGVGAAHPRVRRAVVRALGEYKDEASVDALVALAEQGDPSYYVEAEISRSLGKTKSDKALPVLEKAMDKPSLNDIILSSTLDGYAELGKEESIPMVAKASAYGQPQPARGTAVSALARLSKNAGDKAKDEARETLTELVSDPWLRVKLSAIGALEELKDAKAISALDRAVQSDLDGRVQRRAREAISSIRRGANTTDEVKRLRDDLEKVQKENRELRDRLDKIETRLNGNGASETKG